MAGATVVVAGSADDDGAAEVTALPGATVGDVAGEAAGAGAPEALLVHAAATVARTTINKGQPRTRMTASYDVEVADMLEFTKHLPERSFAPGAVIVHQGGRSDSLWVLVSGRLTVRRDDVELNELSSPGQLIGEVSLLLGIPHTATVTAVEPSLLRHAADGRQLLGDEPAITMHVAAGLAERLMLLTEYVTDITRQYAHVPGISMVSAVLNRMPARGATGATAAGSRRDPEPDLTD